MYFFVKNFFIKKWTQTLALNQHINFVSSFGIKSGPLFPGISEGLYGHVMLDSKRRISRQKFLVDVRNMAWDRNSLLGLTIIHIDIDQFIWLPSYVYLKDEVKLRHSRAEELFEMGEVFGWCKNIDGLYFVLFLVVICEIKLYIFGSCYTSF